jgi:hypothetical protein
VTTAVTEREPTRDAPTVTALCVTQTMEVLKTIRDFVKKEMDDGLDYGLIPGTGTKKTLFLPGAQKVNMLYNCYPEYAVELTELANGHADFRVMTKLVSRSTGTVVGAGLGSCSTMESKYRWRNAGKICPACGLPTLLKSKEKPEWFCWKKKGGCGASFPLDDAAISSQPVGRVENPDIYDVRNTVLKIAKKRSLVDASLGLGCLAELFTQDLEEDAEFVEAAPPAQQRPPQKPPNGKPKQAQAQPSPRTGPPTNGAELLHDLEKYDRILVKDRIIGPGELLKHIHGTFDKEHGPDIAKWPFEAIQPAMDEAKQFHGDMEQRKREASQGQQAPSGTDTHGPYAGKF